MKNSLENRLKNRLENAASIIAGAGHLIAFTGAGISAESGVPTFRGQGGIWNTYDERHLELHYFKREPEKAWKTIRAMFYEFSKPLKPNDAHRVLAGWEQDGILSFVITQNIDGLHRAAGSLKAAEFHGATTDLLCLKCGGRTPVTREILAKLPPRCSCGGLYKPDFTFFSEGIPPEAYAASFAEARMADVCLVIGCTGTVYPAASIPRLVKSSGGVVIEINPEPSEFTPDITDVFIQLGASEALLDLDRRVRAGRQTRNGGF